MTQLPQRSLGLRRLHMIFGVAQMSIGPALIVVELSSLSFIIPTFYAGIWCGIFILISGILGYFAGKNNSYSCLIACIVMSILTSILILIAILVTAIHTSYFFVNIFKAIVMLLMLIGELAFTIVQCSFACTSVCFCSCCKSCERVTERRMIQTPSSEHSQLSTQPQVDLLHTVNTVDVPHNGAYTAENPVYDYEWLLVWITELFSILWLIMYKSTLYFFHLQHGICVS